MSDEPVEMTVCHACKRQFTRDEMIVVDGLPVCAECKPLLVERLLEGLALPGVADYASFGMRFLALFVDGLIMIVPTLLIMAANMMVTAAISSQARNGSSPVAYMMISGVLSVLFMAASFLIPMAYEVLFLWQRGATPGKLLCGIRVINADGRQELSLGKAFGRYFAKMLSQFTCWIGYLIAAFDDERRALHDHICSTRVVNVKR